MDVQSFIETPELYLSGRCQSNKEQLGHVEMLKQVQIVSKNST